MKPSPFDVIKSSLSCLFFLINQTIYLFSRQAVAWIFFAIFSLIRFQADYLLVVGVCLTLSIANIIGFTKCRKGSLTMDAYLEFRILQFYFSPQLLLAFLYKCSYSLRLLLLFYLHYLAICDILNVEFVTYLRKLFTFTLSILAVDSSWFLFLSRAINSCKYSSTYFLPLYNWMWLTFVFQMLRSSFRHLLPRLLLPDSNLQFSQHLVLFELLTLSTRGARARAICCRAHFLFL